MPTSTKRTSDLRDRTPVAGLALAVAIGLAGPAAAQDRWGLSEGGAGPGSLVAQVGDAGSVFAVVCRQAGMHPVIAVGRGLVAGSGKPERITLQVDRGRTYALTDLQANQQIYFAMVQRSVPFFDELAKGTRLSVSTPGTEGPAGGHRLGLRGSARALAPVLERCDGSSASPAPSAAVAPPPQGEPLAPGVAILRTPGFRAEVVPGWCGESAAGRLIATQDIADRPQAIDQLLGALAATLAQVCPEARQVVVSVHAANGAHVGDLRLEDGALWRATADAARDVASAPGHDGAPDGAGSADAVETPVRDAPAPTAGTTSEGDVQRGTAPPPVDVVPGSAPGVDPGDGETLTPGPADPPESSETRAEPNTGG